MMPKTVKELLKAVGTGPKGSRGLSPDEASDIFRLILSGKATHAQIGGVLLSIRTKGETAEEMEGFLRCLQTFCRVPRAAQPVRGLDLGCPYDGHVRNPGLWIPAAIMAAAAGQRMILHGFRDLPAKFGVGLVPVWKLLGRSLSSPSQAREDLEKHSIVCLSQEDIHPELAALSMIRGELGLRTILNTVEKASNPLDASHMAAGYYHETILESMDAMVTACHPQTSVTFVGGQEGSVGLFPHRPTRTYRSGAIEGPKEGVLPPPPEKPEPLAVEAIPESHARSILDLLADPKHPHRKALVWQAATFLVLGGSSPDPEHALGRLEEFRERSRW